MATTTEPEAIAAGAAAEEAAEPAAGMLASPLDPLAFGEALARVAAGLAAHPQEALTAVREYAAGLANAAFATAARAAGAEVDGPVAPARGDRRFNDPAWQRNPFYFALQQGYLLSARFVDDLVRAAELAPPWATKAAFAASLVNDALAPTNTLPGNPTAIKKAFDTGGASLVRGLRNLVSDAASNGGFPRQVDTRPFRVGGNLAATPGKVVLRNDLLELIQFAPQTETVHETPLLLSPPWINKYYILDLAPGKSLAEWAVRHGHTVFVMSYRNPGPDLANVTLDDYLRGGPLAALDAMADITGAPQANVAGLCLGGTLTGMLLSYLAARGEERVRSATLMNTLVDFSDPGPLAAFTDIGSVARLERKMAARGYLDKEEMGRTFSLLRANDLVWGYVGTSWLMGEDPPAFDILYWNADSTRMPAAMHSMYLRACYLENRFARGQLELAGERLDPARVETDLYIVGAEEDHIAPWRSAYAATQLFGGEKRFVLTSSGHVAGVVNPPGPKRRYWLGENGHPRDPALWRRGATEYPGSWWEDWVEWIAGRAGPRREPPSLGSDRFPALADAPGTYVFET